LRIILLPLDERPVNTRYPAMLAAMAGAQLILPPPHLLSALRHPADADALAEWLFGAAREADAAIVSVEMLAFGGLIASRTTDTPLADALHRLDTLGKLRAAGLATIYAFNVITRIPDANDAVEEPEYWAMHGRALHRYSGLLHREAAGQPARAEREAARAALPDAVVADFARRRLRNHTLNLHVLGLAADSALDTLVLSSDDTSEYGLGSQEKAWLATWARRLELPESRLLMYPGADEVGCVLLLRALLAGQRAPRFYIHYAIEGDQAIIAPYEDSPVAVTVERQVRALGGVIVDAPDQADFLLAVNTPTRIRQEYDPAHPDLDAERARRAPMLAAFALAVRDALRAGRKVIVCDVAYPNGADPDLIANLRERVELGDLTAYGAWNTAGNTIGTALAHGVATSMVTTPDARTAARRFLLHRFVEDWGYQHLVRAAIRDELGAATGQRDVTAHNEAEVTAQLAVRLNALLPELGDLSQGWRVTNVRLPWRRTFEIDFDLEYDAGGTG
jgi:hypothetical protein